MSIETLIPVRQYIWAMCRDGYECEHQSFHTSQVLAEKNAETAFLLQNSYDSTVDTSIRQWQHQHDFRACKEEDAIYRLWSAKHEADGLKMYSTDFYIERIELHGDE